MDTKPQREDAVLSLNVAVKAIGLVENISGITPAKAAFGSVSAILVMIRDSMIDEVDYVDLGLACADVCSALGQGLKERRADELSRPVLEAIKWLTTTTAEVERKILKRGSKRGLIAQFLPGAKNSSKETSVAAWMLDLKRILQVFETELLSDNVHTAVPSNTNPAVRNNGFNSRTAISQIPHDVLRNCGDTDGNNLAPYASAPGESSPPPARNTAETVSEIHNGVERSRVIVSNVCRDVVYTRQMVSDIRNILKSEEGAGGQYWTTRKSVYGESPPPPPRVFFGREELIKKIVGSAVGSPEQFLPVALIGAGGIGKTSIALTVLHNDRVKQQFGDNRRFMRCDQFPPSLPHFLGRLSKVVGAGLENPEDLAPLRPFLASKQMFIVLDNAESVLDPRGPNAQEIYAVVEELSQLSNICLCITSRITTVPPGCQTLHVPTLSMEAARDTFYRICDIGEQRDIADTILEQLDFHPLSVTLLATVANQNNWDANRLNKEWKRRGTDVLHTHHNRSLATTIEFSLSSPMFKGLGSSALDLLAVVAFFPQGVDENNIDRLFPTVSNRADIIDTFCVLSLTYRGDGFITMLAPLRDYLRPKDPKSSPLLCAAKEQYFRRMSVDVYPDKPGHKEARWITSEDVNVEHLLGVFASTDPSSRDVWDACANFMRHLHWYKRRPVMLGPMIEALPDNHPSKLECLYELAQLLNLAGDHTESKRLLTHTLQRWREQGDDFRVAQTLRLLANVNRLLGLDKEGTKLVQKSLEIFERLGNVVERAHSLQLLAWLLYGVNQIAAAEEAATQVIGLIPENSEQFLLCRCHRFLGYIHLSKDEAEKAITRFEAARSIASSFNWHTQLFWSLHSLAEVAFCEGRFEDANGLTVRAKSHAVNYTYLLGRAMQLQANIWYQQRRIEEANSEALAAADLLEGLGASQALEGCRALLQQIEQTVSYPESDDNGELSQTGIERSWYRHTPVGFVSFNRHLLAKD